MNRVLRIALRVGIVCLIAILIYYFRTGSLQIALLISIVCLPAIIMGLLVRLKPIYQLAQRSQAIRSVIVLGNGLLSWGISLVWLMWLLSGLSYGLAEFYFDTTLGQVPGVTRANMRDYTFAVTNELWLRQIAQADLSQPCFSSRPVVCQLADRVGGMGMGTLGIDFSLTLSLVPLFINLLLGQYLTRSPHQLIGESNETSFRSSS
jgi:hypothetical protein